MKPYLLLSALLLASCGGGSGHKQKPVPTSPPAPAPNVTLIWEAPNTREDNTCLPASDLSGFRIGYGTSSINEQEVTVVYNLASCSPQGQGSTVCGELLTCQYTLVGVTSGYFAVRAFDSTGVVSAYSNTVVK